MQAESRLSGRAKAWLALAVSLGLLLLLVGMAEVAVRIRQSIKYGYAGSIEQLYEVDVVTGLRVPRAGATLGAIRINSRGFRGPEFEVPKPAGTVRIAFLGASTTFCAEVSSDQVVWPDLVTQSLRRTFNQVRIDYVNGGVPGYTVRSSLKNLQLRVAPLRPDIVVIYHATNDLSVELRSIAIAQGIGRNIAPPDTGWLARHSLLWNLVSKNLRILAAQGDAAPDAGQVVKFDPDKIGARFREDLTELVRAAKETSAVVALTTFSVHMRADQVGDARRRAMETALLYMPGYDFDALVRAFGRYNDIIREVSRQEGGLLIDDEDRIPGDPEHFVDSVHFSDAGSRIQGLRVSEALEKADVIRQLMSKPR